MKTFKKFEHQSKTRPDFDVSALNKLTNQKGRVGDAWTNPDGSIAVILKDFVKLEQDGNLLVTLFPKKPKDGQVIDA